MAKKKKKIIGIVKLQIEGGKATPAPPVGPALSQHKVNISEFVQKFNDLTRDRMGLKLPVEISVYEDKSFDLLIKQPPMSTLIKLKAGVEKGSGNPLEFVGKLSNAQVKEVAEQKMPDLNTKEIESAMSIVMGTARSMGIEIVEG
ncbi:MAG: 50S ribosomal protein L11 [Planctomycetota bacterium]|nr:MAG: 50S ribosomal protein L11 [Planctomycetota bacterium]